MKIILSLLVVFSTHAISGVYYNNLWEKNEVSVCFAQGEVGKRDTDGYVLKVRNWKEKQKSKLRQWVSEEFSAERTGIHFSGFLDCEDSPDADVIIFHNKNSPLITFFLGGVHGLALMGPNPNAAEGYPKARGFISISSSGMDKGTVIHEFGHSAGLHHEHIHYDAFEKDKGRCAIISEDTPFSTRWNYTEYDPDSVMNYCKIQGKGGSKAGLSPKDAELLKSLYP